MINFRAMVAVDIPSGLSFCRLTGWNQLSRDWELFLRLNPDGCRVALDENGSVIGTVTTIPYQSKFAWIGMVLVHPSHRREGIGTALLREAIKLTRKHETVKLDATPAGREVYLKLDFVKEYDISRMKLDSPVLKEVRSDARPVKPDDMPAILELDRQVFGADRHSVLEWSLNGATQFAFVVERQGCIEGFCFGRPGYNFNHIGPIISRDVNVAMQLLSAAVMKSTNKPVIIDVLEHSGAWTTFIYSLGFEKLRSLIRMYRGSNTFPGIPEKQFAILGPEFG
jgi:predicted N-acetyltransferase YhbS